MFFELRPWYHVEMNEWTHVPTGELNRKGMETYTVAITCHTHCDYCYQNTKIPDHEWNDCNNLWKRSDRGKKDSGEI